jgi:ribonuclease-3
MENENKIKSDILDDNRINKLKKFEKKAGTDFEDMNLLNNAFCHSSYVNELPMEYSDIVQDNERLEFLGDSVLALIVNHYLFMNFPDYTEGQLSEIKSIIVSEQYLALIANKMDLDEYLLTGRGVRTNAGYNQNALLADTMEAVIGAYYIDRGLDKVRNFILPFLKAEMEKIIKKKHRKDYKSILQFYVQQKYKTYPLYETIHEEGPDHNKTFYVSVLIEGKIYGHGKGSKKKTAQKQAAREALKKLREEFPEEDI